MSIRHLHRNHRWWRASAGHGARAHGARASTHLLCGWAWALAFVAVLGIAVRAPVLAFDALDAGNVLASICSANGAPTLEQNSSDVPSTTRHSACWCCTPHTALPPAAPTTVADWTPAAHPRVARRVAPPTLTAPQKPASTGPPSSLV